ncbi:MAG: glucosamine-6-phosphate deaminase [Verrucomicrobia bacterium]|nr:glucosamine-6-phosphate deaminase [Verrucomicrobiota bacterium]
MSDPVRTFTVDALSVCVHGHAAALAADAARTAQRCLADAIGTRGSAAVILATGNSQLQFLDALGALGGVDWSRVTCFHMDEYLGLAGDHPASFIRYMRERVESRVKPGKFHFLHGDALEPIKECERYESLLRAQPIDLCCLGVGDNGHLAFNDPPVADFADARWVKIVGLDEMNRKQQAGYGHFKSLDDVPRFGLTLTIPALMAARQALCLAPGKAKAQIVRRLLRDAVGPACPATCLRTQKQATLLLDTDAAGLL